MPNAAAENEIRALEEAYRGRKAFHGEMHDHSASGGTSDGGCTLEVWKREMDELKMDFAAILDHRQVRHMYLPEWDEKYFICGSEPGTCILDSHAYGSNELHYNMIFPSPEGLEAVLAEIPEFEFEGGPEGHFKYPFFTRERFGEIIDCVKAHGGFFVIPHPRQVMDTEDITDYWFRDRVGLEVFYRGLDEPDTEQNYPVWVGLLEMGKKIWACSGGDKHNHPGVGALTTIYAEERRGSAYLPYLRRGDFVCGSAGIRMILGDTYEGGEADFSSGGRLILSAGDFHESVLFPGHEYSLLLLDDRGECFREPIDPGRQNYFSYPVSPDARWYRAEILDDTRSLRISIGNPIWGGGDFA